LSHRRGGAYSRGALILNFGRQEGRLFEGRAYWRFYGVVTS